MHGWFAVVVPVHREKMRCVLKVSQLTERLPPRRWPCPHGTAMARSGCSTPIPEWECCSSNASIHAITLRSALDGRARWQPPCSAAGERRGSGRCSIAAPDRRGDRRFSARAERERGRPRAESHIDAALVLRWRLARRRRPAVHADLPMARLPVRENHGCYRPEGGQRRSRACRPELLWTRLDEVAAQRDSAADGDPGEERRPQTLNWPGTVHRPMRGLLALGTGARFD